MVIWTESQYLRCDTHTHTCVCVCVSHGFFPIIINFVFFRRGCLCRPYPISLSLFLFYFYFFYFLFYIYLFVMIVCKLYWFYCLPAKGYDQQFMKLLHPRLKPTQTFWIHQGLALIKVPEVEQVIYTSLKVNWKATSCQNRSVRMGYLLLGLCWL